MEAVLTVVFRISNPQYSFVPAGSEHGRQSVVHQQIEQLLHDDWVDCVHGDFVYTVHMIVEIRFQKFHFFLCKFKSNGKIVFKHPDYHSAIK